VRKTSEVWVKMQKGDKDALRIIYMEYSQALYDYGKKFSTDASLVEDCIQNLFIDIWTKRTKLSSDVNILPYLLLSLRRRIFREIKHTQKTDLTGDHPFFLSIETGKEEEMIHEEDNMLKNEKLQKALDQLSVKQKEILFLKYKQNLSSQQIAKLMEMNEQSVRNSLHRSISKLKNLMISILFLSTFYLQGAYSYRITVFY
jgi:RNA polymerase sigma factor (sigma-70 family)